MNQSLLGMLDDLKAPAKETYNHGVKLSTITAKFKDDFDVTALLGKPQQLEADNGALMHPL